MSLKLLNFHNDLRPLLRTDSIQNTCVRRQGYSDFLRGTQVPAVPQIAKLIFTFRKPQLAPCKVENRRLFFAIKDRKVVAVSIFRLGGPHHLILRIDYYFRIAGMLIDFEKFPIGKHRGRPLIVMRQVAAHHQWRTKNAPER